MMNTDDKILAELKRQLEAGTIRCTWVQDIDADTGTWKIGFVSKETAKIQFTIEAEIPEDATNNHGRFGTTADHCEGAYLRCE